MGVFPSAPVTQTGLNELSVGVSKQHLEPLSELQSVETFPLAASAGATPHCLVVGTANPAYSGHTAVVAV